MAAEPTTLLWLLGSLLTGWLVATVTVASGAVQLGSWLARRLHLAGEWWLAPEAWMALAASGAAVGGFVALTSVAAAWFGITAGAGELSVLLLLSLLGMIGGAVVACACAALYLWTTAE